ncbi:hypothetical protein GCM10020000_48890 [Streptomyces olivoverticillatus]
MPGGSGAVTSTVPYRGRTGSEAPAASARVPARGPPAVDHRPARQRPVGGLHAHHPAVGAGQDGQDVHAGADLAAAGPHGGEQGGRGEDGLEPGVLGVVDGGADGGGEVGLAADCLVRRELAGVGPGTALGGCQLP